MQSIITFWKTLQSCDTMLEEIYGPIIPHLKGKKVRRNIQNVDPVKITSLTKTILDKYKEVTIWCDLMNINWIGFLNTISHNIMFTIISMIKNRKMENIADSITQMSRWGLRVLIKMVWYFSWSGSPVQFRNFERLRSFGRGDYKVLRPKRGSRFSRYLVMIS